MNRRRFLGLLPWLIGAGLALLIIRTISFDEVISILDRLRLWQVILLILLNLIVLVTFTGRWWLLLAGQGYHLPFTRLFGYRLSVFGLSYFTPGPHIGGEPLQVLLVEKEHGVPRSEALAAVALDKTIEFSLNFTFLLLGLLAILDWRLVPESTGRQALGAVSLLLLLPFVYLGLTAAGFRPLAAIIRPLYNRQILSRWQSRVASAITTLEDAERQVGEFYRRAPLQLALAVLVSFFGLLAMIVEYWLMVRFLGVRLTFPQLITTLTAARLSILVLLPAGLGALEFSQTFSYGLLGLDPAIGLTASLLIRTRDSLLGAIGLWWGSRHIRDWGRPVTRD